MNPTTLMDTAMIDARLSQNVGLSKVKRAGTAIRPDTYTYAASDESAVLRANDLLHTNGFAPAPMLSMVVVPNFYEVTYVRDLNDGAIRLRLARPSNNPVPLALVSVAIDGSTDFFDDSQAVFNPDSRVAVALVGKFALRHPYRGHYWLPRFALPRQRQV